MHPLLSRLLAVVLLTATPLLYAGDGAPAQKPLTPSEQIDQLLAAQWAKHDLQPNPPAPDETFLRRAYLDIIGRIPSSAEAQAFLQSTAPTKRADLIDKLLASDGYAHHQFTFWADLLRAQTAGF